MTEMKYSWLSMMQTEQEHEIPKEDEIELALVATRMRNHFHKNPKEDVIQEITKLITIVIMFQIAYQH